ncbi:unannotated protein [freshwater metagenome]|uniref:Unannotated protein n=1 Tax=freshwater metagenome TaxID=449393 RepID=A0A6J6TQS3_9ZZZZ|nr:hypothetical protein [Actinomycetota bacterium]
MERIVLGDLLVLRDVDHDAVVADGEGASSALRMGGVPLRSLASFSLGGHTCRSGLADASGTAVAGKLLPQPVVLEVSGCPVSIWRLPEWHVGDWTVVHLVLVTRDGAEVPRAVHRDLLGRLQVEHRGRPSPYAGSGSFGGGHIVQFTVELPGVLTDVEVSLQPLTRPGDAWEPVRL